MTGFYLMINDFPNVLFGWEWNREERYFEIYLSLFAIGYQFKNQRSE